MFANDRGSSTIEVSDLLAAIYVASLELERLKDYWAAWERFEQFMASECKVEDSRWNHWLRFHDQILHGPKARHLFRGIFVYRLSKRSFLWKRFWNSPEVDKIYSTARELARSVNAAASEGAPVLTPEHLLLAIARHSELDIAGKLVESGLDLERLEQAIAKKKG